MLERVIFTGFTESDLSGELWQRVHTVVRDVICIPLTDPAFAEHLSTADGLILRLGMKADRGLQDEAPNLRYIGMYGTGYGGIDTAAASARGVTVTNVADYSTESVAEFVVAMVLDNLRNLYAERRRAADGDVAETEFEGRDLRSLRFGVLGAGHIGRRVLELVHQGFGSEIAYWSRTRRPDLEAELGAAYLEPEELLASTDVVSLHLAWNPETTEFLDATRVGQLSSGSILVNTAPNEILDLTAVSDRCQRGELTFSMDHADELSHEDRQRLLDTPHVSVYPPIGYATREASRRKQEILVENIEAFLDGAPKNKVN